MEDKEKSKDCDLHYKVEGILIILVACSLPITLFIVALLSN